MKKIPLYRIDTSKIEQYLYDNDSYIEKKEIPTNKKIREIITYNDFQLKGMMLKKFHKVFLLHLYDSVDAHKYSYAYKKNSSIKDAVINHLKSSYFIKFDIKDFFKSITLDNFMRVSKFYNILENNMLEFIPYCFYNNYLPQGFVTSPKISDMYLMGLDKIIEKQLESNTFLHYSRYCDDILISIENINNHIEILENFYNFIVDLLGKFKMEINTKKTKRINLETSTSIKFLGLNISKEKYSNICKITISKNFILRTFKSYDKYIEVQKKENRKSKYIKSIIMGRVEFLRNNAPLTYNKFLKKFQNKYNIDYLEIIEFQTKKKKNTLKQENPLFIDNDDLPF